MHKPCRAAKFLNRLSYIPLFHTLGLVFKGVKWGGGVHLSPGHSGLVSLALVFSYSSAEVMHLGYPLFTPLHPLSPLSAPSSLPLCSLFTYRALSCALFLGSLPSCDSLCRLLCSLLSCGSEYLFLGSLPSCGSVCLFWAMLHCVYLSSFMVHFHSYFTMYLTYTSNSPGPPSTKLLGSAHMLTHLCESSGTMGNLVGTLVGMTLVMGALVGMTSVMWPWLG